MVRFIHTSDWQLGMTRHFLSEEAQARFTQARFDAIRAIGRIAVEERCEFVVVCGDVFESNQVDRRTVLRALEALGTVSVPVYLLPGNHDPLDPGSVFHSSTFRECKSSNVHVIEGTTPIEITPGVEVVGAPWTSKRPLRDLVASVSPELGPSHGTTRVFLAHGAIDILSPDRENPALIRLAGAEASLADGRIHYLALGDRHSLTPVGETGRIWYSGTPEPTDFDEGAPGHVLVVEVGPQGVTASKRELGTWRFIKNRFDLASDADLDALEAWLAELDNKERTILRLSFRGTLTLRQHARLESIIERAKDLFASVEIPDGESDLAILPGDSDFAELELSGFARTTTERLRHSAEGGGPTARTARDALALLVRLAGGSS